LHFFNVTIDAVEIDPEVVYIAKKYFNISESDRLHIYVGDGRSFIKNAGDYGIICIDVFAGGFDVPFHLATKEFFMDVKKSLNDDGVVLMNVLSIDNDTQLVNSMANTLHSVFPSVYILESGEGNHMLVAFKNKTEFNDLNFDYPNDELAEVLNKSRKSIRKFNKTSDLVFTDDRTNIEKMSFDMTRNHIERMNRDMIKKFEERS